MPRINFELDIKPQASTHMQSVSNNVSIAFQSIDLGLKFEVPRKFPSEVYFACTVSACCQLSSFLLLLSASMAIRARSNLYECAFA